MFGIKPQLISQLNRTIRNRLNGLEPVEPRTSPFLIPHREKRKTTSLHLETSPDVDPALTRSVEKLLSVQTPEGFWEGRVYDNVTITSEYVMLLRFLGLLNSEIKAKAKKTILDCQLENGGWNIFFGGPADHSATVEAYFALKLCGMTPRQRPLKIARELILKHGGAATSRVFTKINLALFGEYPWSRVPVINPELMFLPRKAPIHIYEFSSWSRAVIVPLLIVFDQKPVVSLPAEERVSELFLPVPKEGRTAKVRRMLQKPKVDLERIFEVAQTVLSIYEKVPLKPLRNTALARAEKWVLEHQDPNGNWGGIYPAMANALMALHLRGYSLDDPILKKGLAALRSFAEETPDSFRMQSTISPIWDSGIAAFALQEAGMEPSHPAIEKCVAWLLKKQILTVRGDWKYKAKPTRPGGWPFEHENDQYPDIDDTALAILALVPTEHQKNHSKKLSESINRGIEWMLGMQGSDGGWGAFDRDNNRQILNQIPFADLKSLLDPSTPDVTGHVIEALGAVGYTTASEPIRHAISFLKKTQEKDGSWYGRWGVAYVYGTAAVLSGLKTVGEKMSTPYIQRSLDWIESVQNSDGGWGESCDAYKEGQYLALGNSTASQTAWGLIALLTAPKGREAAIERGVDYLRGTQDEDGGWTEPEWTGTGFPKHFYLRYDYYRLYFPVLALGRYARWKRRSSSN